MISLTKMNNIPGIFLLVDFEKAFDTVEWKYMDEVLRKFDFDDDFRKWVKIFIQILVVVL